MTASRSITAYTISSEAATRHHGESTSMAMSNQNNSSSIFHQIQTVVADKIQYSMLPKDRKDSLHQQKLKKIRTSFARSRTGVWGPTHSSDSDSTSTEIWGEPTNSVFEHYSPSRNNDVLKRQAWKNHLHNGGGETPNTSTTREETIFNSTNGSASQHQPAESTSTLPQQQQNAESAWSTTFDRLWESASSIFQQIQFTTTTAAGNPCAACAGIDNPPYSKLHNEDGDDDSKTKNNNSSKTDNELGAQKTTNHDDQYNPAYTPTKSNNYLPRAPPMKSTKQEEQNKKSLSKMLDKIASTSPNARKILMDDTSDMTSQISLPKNIHGEETYDDENALAAAKAAAAAVLSQQITSTGNKQIRKNNDLSSLPPPSPTSRKNRSCPLTKQENQDFDQQNDNNKPPPCSFLEITSEMIEIERSISELTMRSCHGGFVAQLSENRRMAYYAVGKQLNQSNTAKQQRGGNRRCYFTGNLIHGDKPFYAGCVQQGLRTLVVFCSPAALELPTLESLKNASLDGGKDISVSSLSKDLNELMNESSFDILMNALPEPNSDLLKSMKERYHDQYKTLPIQVRSASCWKIYIKFCFFSGLPIAESDVHYRVKTLSESEEEIILSHEVMVTVNGEQSADILRLPNKKTFQYLQKHYAQQSSKLPETIFDRRNWEMVRPEV